MMRTTVTAVAGALVEEAKRRVLGEAASATTAHDREWTGLGLEWLRSLLGRREWRVPCVDVVIRL